MDVVVVTACTPGPTTYSPREPERTVLYQVLQEHLETFLERAQADGRTLPHFVINELRAFLRCGIRAYGFLRVRCPSCRHEYAVAFSCKGRGVCPSCCGRFMAHTAAHLVDNVLPNGVDYRQWVLTLPFQLRPRAAYDPELCNAILRIFVGTLSDWQCARARAQGVDSPQWGAITVAQRFGSALQLTPHFHTVGPDAVFSVPDGAERAEVYALAPPTNRDVEQLVERVHGRVLRLLKRRGLLADEDADYQPEGGAVDDPMLASCYDHALRVPQRRLALAQPRPGTRPVSKSRLCVKFRGFDLHAAVTVSAYDRYGLERLCRYLCRPALSHERLEQLDDAHVGLRLKTAFSDGTSHLALTFDELLQRLCALVPRPGTHRVRYHGILAPAARDRSKVVPVPDEELSVLGDVDRNTDHDALIGFDDEAVERARRPTVRKLLWAELLRRVFSIDVLKCPRCSGRMRVIATIVEAKVVRAILDALGLESAPPAVRSYRGPPDWEVVEYAWY